MGPSWAHAFIVATCFTLAITPLLRRVAIATDFVDRPVAAHKSHKHATPYLGGIGLIFAVLTGLLFAGRVTPLVVATAIGGGMIGCLGLVDDHRSVGPLLRFGCEGELPPSSWTWGSGYMRPTFAFIDGLLTIIWIVGVTNAVNFLDNMDGLAAGIAAAAASAIFALAVLSGSSSSSQPWRPVWSGRASASWRTTSGRRRSSWGTPAACSSASCWQSPAWP